MRIKPFNALRPPIDLTAKVASPPYDVMSIAEAKVITDKNPMSFLHITMSAVDLPADVDEKSPEAYKQAHSALNDFVSKGYLQDDPEPALYLYRLTMNGHAQRGVVTVSHTLDYDNELIKKHEHTRRAPEEDRTLHIKTLEAQTGPVFLTYRDDAKIDAFLAEVEKGTPLYDYTADDGIDHAVWKIEDCDTLVSLFADIPTDYIADGHHRAAASACVAREYRAANGGDELAEPNWFLTVIFPAGQLKIMPYNRCVKGLNGLTEEAFIDQVKAAGFAVAETDQPSPAQPGTVCMYLGKKWYELTCPKIDSDDPVKLMDVSILQEKVLSPILDIQDPRKDARIFFVGGIRGTAELEKNVNSDEATVAFSMYPTSIEQLMSVSDADKVMPPKSTWFEPKLRSGLFVHRI